MNFLRKQRNIGLCKFRRSGKGFFHKLFRKNCQAAGKSCSKKSVAIPKISPQRRIFITVRRPSAPIFETEALPLRITIRQRVKLLAVIMAFPFSKTQIFARPLFISPSHSLWPSEAKSGFEKRISLSFLVTKIPHFCFK